MTSITTSGIAGVESVPTTQNTVFLYGIVQISRTFLGLLKSPGLCWFQPNQSEDRGSEKKRLYDTTLQQDLCLLKSIY